MRGRRAASAAWIRWNAAATRRSAATRSGRRSSSSDGRPAGHRRRHRRQIGGQRELRRGIAAEHDLEAAHDLLLRGRKRALALPRAIEIRAGQRDVLRAHLPDRRCASAPGAADRRTPPPLPPPSSRSRSVAIVWYHSVATMRRQRLARVEQVGLGRLPRGGRRTRPARARGPTGRAPSETSPAMPGAVAWSRRVPTTPAPPMIDELRIQQRARLRDQRRRRRRRARPPPADRDCSAALPRPALRAADRRRSAPSRSRRRRPSPPRRRPVRRHRRRRRQHARVSASAGAGGCFTAQPAAAASATQHDRRTTIAADAISWTSMQADVVLDDDPVEIRRTRAGAPCG